MKMLEREITVGNPRGVHSRVATGLARIARQHGVRVILVHGREKIDCSSILDVLSMALVCGTCLRVMVAGDLPRAEKAMAAVAEILTAADE